jgi:hypothetical protein
MPGDRTKAVIALRAFPLRRWWMPGIAIAISCLTFSYEREKEHGNFLPERGASTGKEAPKKIGGTPSV